MLRLIPRCTLLAFTLAALMSVSGCARAKATPATVEAAPPAPAAVERPAAPAAPAQPASGERAERTDRAERTGSVTAAPGNLRRFSPREATAALPVPADQIDLRKLFEELGPDVTLWYQHVQTLANPFFEGRAPGTRGDELAAEYIEFYFRTYGLEPAFPSQTETYGGGTQEWTSYRQNFDFASPNPDVQLVGASMSINGTPLKEGSDFVVLGNSGNASVTAPVTFVGYSIEEGRDGYTSFDEHTDLTGRIALVFRYEPLDEQGKSRWSSARFSASAAMAGKMHAAARRGAAGIILVNPPGAVDGKTTLETLRESARFGRRMQIPVVQISHDIGNAILSKADPQGRDLLAWRRLADNAEVRTVTFDDSLHVSIHAELDAKDRLHTYNLAGVLRGKGTLANEWIVIGGHYDHVGYGYTGAMPANVGQLHPGADDNASGIASMLIAAKRMTQTYAKAGDDANLRSIVFMGFGGEEAGLHGSRFFVENSPISTGAMNLMINLDMVGRLRNNSVLVQGTGTAVDFPRLLKPLFEASGLNIAASPGGRGPSDHSSFYSKNVPVLFFFTGEHADYHKPTDHAYTVNPVGGVKIVDLVEAVALHFAKRPERLRFASSAGQAAPRETGARVSLGTIPDYTAELETGMRVEDVREGSSAAEAGIQPGDVLLTWNGAELAGARALAEFLAKHEPGDRVTIVLRRGDEEVTINVHLKGRAAQ